MEIEKILFRLSREITESQHDNPLLIGIPRRGDLIAKRISDNLKNFNFSHDLDTVDYIPFRDDIIEDIEKTLLIYTGRTLRASIEAVMHSGRPKLISLLCLVDRGHRELPISPKFIGKNIPTNESDYVSVFLEEIDNIDKIEVT